MPAQPFMPYHVGCIRLDHIWIFRSNILSLKPGLNVVRTVEWTPFRPVLDYQMACRSVIAI